MLRLAVLVSGGGTNLGAILDAIERGRRGEKGLSRLMQEKTSLTASQLCGRAKEAAINDAEVTLVLSNNPDAYALERARERGINSECISPKNFGTREEFNAALLGRLVAEKPDLIVLAGFLVVIPPAIVEAFPKQIINIHPSLIPSFCGKGYYGLHVHEKVIEAGAKVSGATVHFVDAGTDTGPVIMQRAVYVRDDDTPERLQRRIMEEAEWKLLPSAIDLIAHDRLEVEGHRVRIKEFS